MVEGSIARRYAKALFELAREEQANAEQANAEQANTAQLIDRLGEDLSKLVASTESVAVLSNPTFTLTERKAVLDALLPSLNLHPVGTSFARLLLEKGRFGALPQVLGEYQAMTDIEAGRVRAEVVASGEMSPEVKTAIAAALSKATGKNVVLTTRTDPSLLGGLVARVGSQVFDASLKTRLDNIQRSLLDES